MNKHKITQDGKHIYTINTCREQKQKDGQHIYTINTRREQTQNNSRPTRREQTQNNSRRATHIHNEY